MSFDVIADIKDRLPVPEYIQRDGVVLKREGRVWAGCCPFHNEKTGSFKVWDDHYKCFGCGEGGDLFTYHQKTRSCDFKESLRELAREAGIELKQTPEQVAETKRLRERAEVLTAAAEHYHGLLKPEHREYLHRRGFTDEFIDSFKFGFAPGGAIRQLSADPALLKEIGLVNEQGRDFLYRRIVIPVYGRDKSAVINLVGRRWVEPGEEDTGPRKFVRLPGDEQIINEWALRGAKTVYVCEGDTDTPTLVQAGLSAVGLPGASALKDEWIEKFARVETVYVCADADKAGDGLIRKAGEAFGPRARIVCLPASLDVNDYVGKQGNDITALAATAPTYLDWLTSRLPEKLKPEDADAAIKPIAAALGKYGAPSQEMYAKALSKRFGIAVAAVRLSIKEAQNGHQNGKPKLRIVQPGEVALTPVTTAVVGAPVPAAAVVPSGWRLSDGGIARESTSSDEDGGERTSISIVCPAPVLIAGRLRDITEGEESVHLCWLRDNGWRYHTAERKVIANARALVDLAGVGLPVTSGTSGDLVDYLAAYETANIREMPKANVSRQMGWVGDAGKLGFLWGRQLVTADGIASASLDPSQASPDEWSEDFVGFRGQDGGDDQIADAFTQLGTFEAWRETVAPVAKHPRALLALYGSFVPPIQSILEVPNFAMDFAFATSTGKTTTLRVAGSVWGCPDERAPSSVIGTWDATRVWIERASTILNGLPLFLDDTKRAKNTKIVAQTVYDVSSGRGKGRGSPRGMRRAGSWCTVLLSTGEAQITSFTEDGGTRARTLGLWGAPFGVANETTTALVHRLNVGVCGNYGHAGPRFVQWVQQHRDDWPAWRDEYRRSQVAYQERAGGNAVASRYAAYFAALDMTAALAHAALDLPWDYHDPVDKLWDQLIAGANEADRASAARDYVVSWAAGHQSEFWGRHLIGNDENPRTMSEGWAGRWDKGDDWRYIGFLHHRLKGILTAAGYEADPTMRLWKDRDWLVTDAGRPSLTAKVDGAAIRMIALKREACNESGE